VWKIALTVVLLAVALAVLAATRPVAVEAGRVGVTEVKRAPVVLVAGGYIAAHHKIQLGSKVMGRVAWIGVEKGDRVKKDQVLVRLDDTEYRAQVQQWRGNLQAAEARLQQLEAGSRPEEIQAAQARWEEATANLRKARLDLERIQTLARDGIASKEALDNAQSQHDMTVAQLQQALKSYELTKLGPRREEIDNARAVVQQARGSLGYAETQLEATVIRSPINGTVLERLVEAGEMVTTMFVGERGAKSSVVSLADLNDLQVELDISQNEFARVALGQNCSIVPDAFPDRTYRGRVAEIAPEADRQKATVQVKVRIEKPDQFLRPEMNARVSFEDPKGGQVTVRELRVPKSAVLVLDGKTVVYAVENSRAVLKSVILADENSSGLRVESGLAGDETIVLRNPAALKDGQRVKSIE
jgi:HlyD family secretion protein